LVFLNVKLMERRTFLKNIGLSAAAVALPEFLSGKNFPVEPRPMDEFAPVKVTGDALELEFEPYELQLRHSFNLASMSRTVTPGVQVRIKFGDLVGYGEASMPPYLGESVASVTSFLSQVNLAQFSDPFRMEEILAYVDAVAPGNNAAKASVDIALHDLVGKLLDAPWYKIWGLSAEKAPSTSFTIGIDTAEMVRKKVEEAAPYNILKVKMGLDNDRETIEVIRSMTDRPICVDVNQGWKSKELALEMCNWLAERNCLFVEQPMPKEMRDDIAWLRERSPLPLIADEAVKRLSEVAACVGVYDGINIKLMKSTGMREAYQMAILAKALGLKVMLGCMIETSCGLSAAAQLAPLADFADLDGNLLISNDLFTGMQIVNGKVTLNERPGIGVTPL
jgi:L-alanine-DL-glutamate epimerase-like enolase superfamily enzyme